MAIQLMEKRPVSEKPTNLGQLIISKNDDTPSGKKMKGHAKNSQPSQLVKYSAKSSSKAHIAQSEQERVIQPIEYLE